MVLTLRQGSRSTVDELTASAFLTVELDRSLGGNAVQVRRFEFYLSTHLLTVTRSRSGVSNNSWRVTAQHSLSN